jgi:hypothetical protein
MRMRLADIDSPLIPKPTITDFDCDSSVTTESLYP